MFANKHFGTEQSASFFKEEGEMNRIRVCVLAGFLALILTSGAAWAQATRAQISGTVKDQSGADLPGVEITATQTATEAKRTTVSNETGNNDMTSLPLG